jgi:DNA invertase Pin-like site-specific DNA recombinase
VITYKVDRLSRSLLDFAKIMETFEKRQVAFVSVTQQFNTATSMGRLVLNVLLSFAQFEREIISERTRDKSRLMALAMHLRHMNRSRLHPFLMSVNSNREGERVFPYFWPTGQKLQNRMTSLAIQRVDLQCE